MKSARPSSLRHVLKPEDSDVEDDLATPIKKLGESSSRLSISIPEEIVDGNSEAESDAPNEPVLRQRSTREAARTVGPWAYLKRPKKAMQELRRDDDTPTPDEEELPEDFPRCATCAKPLHERVWYSNRYFDHCQR